MILPKFSGDVWTVAYELSKSENVKFHIVNIDQGVGLLKVNYKFKYIREPNIKDKNFNDYKNLYYSKFPIINIYGSLNFIKSD